MNFIWSSRIHLNFVPTKEPSLIPQHLQYRSTVQRLRFLSTKHQSSIQDGLTDWSSQKAHYRCGCYRPSLARPPASRISSADWVSPRGSSEAYLCGWTLHPQFQRWLHWKTFVQYTNAAACQVAANLDIFKILVENEKPISIDAIAEKTKADPLLIGKSKNYFMSTESIQHMT